MYPLVLSGLLGCGCECECAICIAVAIAVAVRGGGVCRRKGGGREEDIGAQGRGPAAAVDGAAVRDQGVLGVQVEDLEVLFLRFFYVLVVVGLRGSGL